MVAQTVELFRDNGNKYISIFILWSVKQKWLNIYLTEGYNKYRNKYFYPWNICFYSISVTILQLRLWTSYLRKHREIMSIMSTKQTNKILHWTNRVIPRVRIVTDALHIHWYMSTYAINYEHVLNSIVYLEICVYALSYIILM